ncbi:MAG: hypothetical protein QM755_02780 [Luteolibacter sp.]
MSVSLLVREILEEGIVYFRWLYEGAAGFVVGTFCVAAAPWCVRILYQSTWLRWLFRGMAAGSMYGLWQMMRRMHEIGGGAILMESAMAVTLLGVFLIPGERKEEK